MTENLERFKKELSELDKTSKSPVTWGNLNRVIEGISLGVLDMRQAIKERLDAIDAKLIEIERKGVEFCGVHQKAQDYRRGSMLVSGGSLWAAVRDIKAGETPGASDGFQLCAKAGRDAR